MDFPGFLAYLETVGYSRSDTARLDVYARQFEARTAAQSRTTEFEHLKALLGDERPGYVTLRRALEMSGRSAHRALTALGFQPKNVYIGGTKTRCWVRGWNGENLTRSIASGELPDLALPPPPC